MGLSSRPSFQKTGMGKTSLKKNYSDLFGPLGLRPVGPRRCPRVTLRLAYTHGATFSVVLLLCAFGLLQCLTNVPVHKVEESFKHS